jgi:hypothetical protein
MLSRLSAARTSTPNLFGDMPILDVVSAVRERRPLR